MCLSKVQRGMSLFFRREKKIIASTSAIHETTLRRQHGVGESTEKPLETGRCPSVNGRLPWIANKTSRLPSYFQLGRYLRLEHVTLTYLCRYLLQAYPCEDWGKNGVTMR